ncbi:MAG: ElyC/SanA/YdcF family protein [Eubacteriales bacterium]|nr:ElyC/SanA/YdcF family protein [Eubacteriales bacterium]
MGIGLLILGAACLVYFGFLAAVSMDFGIIWLAAGAVFLAAGIFWKRILELPFGVKLAAGIFLGICLVVFLFVEALIGKSMLEKPESGLDKIVVLGAQVRGKTPSRALTKRLEKALSYLEENPQTAAVLSGGQGEGEEITEAQAMYEWLTARGISEDRLLLEERSTSTEENLRFSAELLDPQTDRVGILTNNFHVFRAVSLAKKQGYAHAYGIAAPSDPRYQVHYLVREFFALVKEKLKGNL